MTVRTMVAPEDMTRFYRLGSKCLTPIREVSDE